MDMIKITYTNGDVQNINVTGDFFTITLAPSNGKPVKLTPGQKAEALAFDLADQYRYKTRVAQIDVFHPNQHEPKTKYYELPEDKEVEEKTTAAPSFIRELKAMKKEWKHKKHTQHWKWLF